MTLPTFPNNLAGITFNRTKRPVFSSRVLTARSGKEQRVANWPFPKWQFELEYEFLRENTNTEFQTLVGFFLSCFGQQLPFLYQDPFDNTVAAQVIGVGDGSTQNFRLVRAFGGFVDQIYNASITNVYVGGVLQSGSAWSAAASGSYGNDTVHLNSAPGSNVTVSADFTFNFVCRFLNDQYDFTQLWTAFWEQKKLDFTTVF